MTLQHTPGPWRYQEAPLPNGQGGRNKGKAHDMRETQRQPNCEERIDAELAATLAYYQRVWDAHCAPDASEEAQEEFCTRLLHYDYYGLSFDWVAPGTFTDQTEGYYRYQISWGGPSEEFRFFVDPDKSCHRMEYWFMVLFDGAHRDVTGNPLVQDLWGWFKEAVVGTTWTRPPQPEHED